jgi:hypothetical protein
VKEIGVVFKIFILKKDQNAKGKGKKGDHYNPIELSDMESKM